MTINTEDLLNSILESIGRIDYIRPANIPNIDLYMDQVTTFMEEQLKSTKRYKEDKILTKTMINNYAKNNLLPPPVKKKYTKEHVLVLIFVYYFKNLLSIKDIEILLKPLTDRYFASDAEFDMQQIYEEVCKMEKGRIEQMQESIRDMYASAQDAYEDAPEEEREYLQLFAFICNLSFDVYVKKQLIEKLIDQLPGGRIKK
ncbi:DUF1836 domain-containing protein [Bariatricus massiliensis]|uniref:DUF1836 domain-containing protein n=1 Tax=Bariatricus massiliensis TaxID=1745713 RepID=A0ABS8DJI3_9FIRM|nr:DUF1836 domain-containing protein [Bariatricus massiliensis]MCB7305399.1 DUF1836 domain-containing protein [Bariatricus massiliensis]MCB7375953.1 DUF1836 domain-containing protein [Bariatricus massiliensis]MCB7388542.1 DUF1836 domain-containing protein [Bariatricus massiliensis]MCB7412715.1 DUF1836 domain-containing protein [Bariatricus massiliensis]MCQ5252133.1 DUF1836 domain-containing protein [Bariatricus massiliensis]